MSRYRPIRTLVGLGLVAAALSACSTSGAAAPEELSGWSRSQLHSHVDMVDYDRVATGSDGQRAAWLSRARGKTDRLAVTVWSPTRSAASVELAAPNGVPDSRLVPAAVAVDPHGWTAVAQQVRDAGGPTALVVWSGVSDTAGEPVTLVLPEGRVVSRVVAAGRIRGVAVVLALVATPSPGEKGLPEASDLVLWTASVGANGTIAADAWQRTQPSLGTRLPLKSAALSGATGPELVLAGVTRDGIAHLWTSTDGLEWQPVSAELPTDVADLDLLTQLADGPALLAWSKPPGRSVQVSRFDGGAVTDVGTVTGAEDWTTYLNAATVVADRLVIGGTATRAGTWRPVLYAQNDDGEWVANSESELAGQLDWSVQALVAQGEDRLGAVLTSTPFHIDVSTWTWRRPTEDRS